MKSLIKISIQLKKTSVVIFIITVLLLMSCSKESPFTTTPPISNSPQLPFLLFDSLKGREFIFSATWLYWRDANDTTAEEIYVDICQSDSFPVLSMVNYQTEVSVLLDGSAQWTNVTKGYSYQGGPWNPGNSGGFVWNVLTRSCFLIDNYPLNYQLPGTPVKVKVKFL